MNPTSQAQKPVVRAKFWINSITHHQVSSPDSCCSTIKLTPCYGTFPGGDSEENKSFSKWTPSGSIEMQITNPTAIDKFELGKAYYIDFTPCE